MRVGKKYKIGEAEEKKPHKVPYIKRFWPTYFVPRFKELKHDCRQKSENYKEKYLSSWIINISKGLVKVFHATFFWLGYFV